MKGDIFYKAVILNIFGVIANNLKINGFDDVIREFVSG